MRRFKSIDIVRGLCIIIMVYGHPFEWWLIQSDQWLFFAYYAVLGNIAGMGFIFISGLSTVLFYRSRLHKANNSDDYSLKRLKHEYFIKALIILLIAFIFNFSTALSSSNIFNIWKWFIMMTIGFSLLISYPLLKTPIYIRIIIAIGVWIANQFLLSFLLPFEGQANLNGILFHFFYNSLDLHPILYYFGFFIVGTAIGDMIFKVFNNKEEEESPKEEAIKKFMRNLLILGIIFVFFGVIIKFPDFLIHDTISSLIYSIGFIILLLAVFLIIEELNLFKMKKSYKFVFYYSYYSLTIYLLHFLLYFIFLNSLNAVTIWFAIFGVGLILTTLIRFIYNKIGPLFSLKIQIGRISSGSARLIEERKTLK